MFHQLPPYAGTAALPSAPTSSVVVASGGFASVAPAAVASTVPAAPSGGPLDLSRVPPNQHHAALEYAEFASRLTFNSKELINMLTRVAGENLHNADAIVAVLEQRIVAALPAAKLPLLYLVDSIVKNIGSPYAAVFGVNLFHIFTTAYANTTPEVRMNMHRLLNMWPPIFGMEVVTAMRRRAADIDAAAQHMGTVPIQGRAPAYPGLQMPQGLRMPQGMQMPPPNVPPPNAPQPPINPSQPPMAPYAQQLGKPAMPQRPVMGLVPPQSAALGLSQGAARPVLRSAAVSADASAAPAQPSPQFTRVESMMHDISRKASMGVAPSNHQLFTINRLITTLLSASASSPTATAERDSLLRFQQQLREIPARVVAQPRPTASTPFPTPPFAQPHAIPGQASQALSSLLRNPPPGLLAPQQHRPNMLRGAIPRGPPPAAMSAMHAPPPHGPPVPRRPSPAAPTLPKVLKFSDLKNVSHASAVRSLYTDLPHLSKSDGMRFATKGQLREHLDWLFKKNRSKRARERGLAIGGSSRCWFEPLKDIFGVGRSPAKKDGEDDNASGTTTPTANGSEGAGSARGADESTAILAQGASEKCQACHEELESFWSDEQQAWMVRDAIRTDDNEVYHKTCIEMSGTAHDSTDHADEAPVENKDEPTPSPAKQETAPTPKLEEASIKAVEATVKAEQTPAVPTLDQEPVPAMKQEAAPVSKKRQREEDSKKVAVKVEDTKQEGGDGESPAKRVKMENENGV